MEDAGVWHTPTPLRRHKPVPRPVTRAAQLRADGVNREIKPPARLTGHHTENLVTGQHLAVRCSPRRATHVVRQGVIRLPAVFLLLGRSGDGECDALRYGTGVSSASRLPGATHMASSGVILEYQPPPLRL